MAALAQADNLAVGRAIFAGCCASLVGIGLARFAYTPLIPALVAAHWFAPAAAVYLGAANLAGYFGGALAARQLAVLLGAAAALRAMMSLATAAFFACALPLSFAWYFGWRFAAGVAGGTLMALAAPAVLPQVPPHRRGLAGGAIFTGVGLGIAASGTVVPLLLRCGPAAAWLGLGTLSLGLTLVAWNGWPRAVLGVPAPAGQTAPLRGAPRGALTALYICYGLNAVGLVPHMVLLVDFVSRGLGAGLAGGAHYWVLFGLGALAGPLAAGRIADRIGFAPALRLAFAAQAVWVAAIAASAAPVVLALSSLVVGAAVPGVVALALGRVHELLPRRPAAQQCAWAWCTIAFALGQGLAAYGYAALFARSGGEYRLLFALAAGVLLLALFVDLGSAAVQRSAGAG